MSVIFWNELSESRAVGRGWHEELGTKGQEHIVPLGREGQHLPNKSA